MTKAYQERLLENNVRRLLFKADTAIGLQYRQEKVGTPDFIVNFPFVRILDSVVDRIIKPFVPCTRGADAGANAWRTRVDKIHRLRKRRALPEHVLFPVIRPSPNAKAFAAYEEIRDDLTRADVQVVLASDEPLILDFAGAAVR